MLPTFEFESQAVKVNSLGKWKTALQMVALSVMLMARQPVATYVHLLPASVTLEAGEKLGRGRGEGATCMHLLPPA